VLNAVMPASFGWRNQQRLPYQTFYQLFIC